MYMAKAKCMHAQVVPEMVARVHTLLPQSYDWSGGDGKPGASEDKRERAEVQRAYYGFLNALAQNQLLQCLQVSATRFFTVTQAYHGCIPSELFLCEMMSTSFAMAGVVSRVTFKSTVCEWHIRR